MLRKKPAPAPKPTNLTKGQFSSDLLPHNTNHSMADLGSISHGELESSLLLAPTPPHPPLLNNYRSKSLNSHSGNSVEKEIVFRKRRDEVKRRIRDLFEGLNIGGGNGGRGMPPIREQNNCMRISLLLKDPHFSTIMQTTPLPSSSPPPHLTTLHSDLTTTQYHPSRRRHRALTTKPPKKAQYTSTNTSLLNKHMDRVDDGIVCIDGEGGGRGNRGDGKRKEWGRRGESGENREWRIEDLDRMRNTLRSSLAVLCNDIPKGFLDKVIGEGGENRQGKYYITDMRMQWKGNKPPVSLLDNSHSSHLSTFMRMYYSIQSPKYSLLLKDSEYTEKKHLFNKNFSHLIKQNQNAPNIHKTIKFKENADFQQKTNKNAAYLQEDMDDDSSRVWLFMELEGMIIHTDSVDDNSNNEYNILIKDIYSNDKKYNIKYRPFLFEFLERFHRIYNFCVYSTCSEQFIQQVMALIDPDIRLFKGYMGRDYCLRIANPCPLISPSVPIPSHAHSSRHTRHLGLLADKIPLTKSILLSIGYPPEIPVHTSLLLPIIPWHPASSEDIELARLSNYLHRLDGGMNINNRWKLDRISQCPTVEEAIKLVLAPHSKPKHRNILATAN